MDIDPDIMKTPFAMAANISIQQLQHHYSDAAGLAEKMAGIVRRANGGMVFSVRRLEIELMHAGTVRQHLITNS